MLARLVLLTGTGPVAAALKTRLKSARKIIFEGSVSLSLGRGIDKLENIGRI